MSLRVSAPQRKSAVEENKVGIYSQGEVGTAGGVAQCRNDPDSIDLRRSGPPDSDFGQGNDLWEQVLSFFGGEALGVIDPAERKQGGREAIRGGDKLRRYRKVHARHTRRPGKGPSPRLVAPSDEHPIG